MKSLRKILCVISIIAMVLSLAEMGMAVPFFCSKFQNHI